MYPYATGTPFSKSPLDLLQEAAGGDLLKALKTHKTILHTQFAKDIIKGNNTLFDPLRPVPVRNLDMFSFDKNPRANPKTIKKTTKHSDLISKPSKLPPANFLSASVKERSWGLAAGKVAALLIGTGIVAYLFKNDTLPQSPPVTNKTDGAFTPEPVPEPVNDTWKLPVLEYPSNASINASTKPDWMHLKTWHVPSNLSRCDVDEMKKQLQPEIANLPRLSPERCNAANASIPDQPEQIRKLISMGVQRLQKDEKNNDTLMCPARHTDINHR